MKKNTSDSQLYRWYESKFDYEGYVPLEKLEHTDTLEALENKIRKRLQAAGLSEEHLPLALEDFLIAHFAEPVPSH